MRANYNETYKKTEKKKKNCAEFCVKKLGNTRTIGTCVEIYCDAVFDYRVLPHIFFHETCLI